MHDDINTKRTELANNLAAAGAALLNFTSTAAALAAIPDTEPQQYVAAGTPENIAAILPATICPQRRQKHGERPSADDLEWDDAATSGDAPNDLLTDSEITEISRAHRNANGALLMDLSFARAIEREVRARIERTAAPATASGDELLAKPLNEKASETELARAWMISHGYGNNTIVGALADLHGRIQRMTTIPTEAPSTEQEWAKVDPAVAFHLIDRHAEDWADAGRMMLAWRDANPAPATASGDELPPLPEMSVIDRHIETGIVIRGYTADQMRAYARAAVSAATKPTADSGIDELNEFLAWYRANDYDGIEVARAAWLARSLLATKPAAVPEGWMLVPKVFVTEVRRAAEIADSYSPSIDSIDEHGGEECEEPIWQIHHILYYAHAKLFGSRAATPAASTPAIEQAKAEPMDEFRILKIYNDLLEAAYNAGRRATDPVEFARAIEAELVSRCRAQGGVTNNTDSGNSAASTTGAAQAAEQVRDQALEEAAQFIEGQAGQSAAEAATTAISAKLIRYLKRKEAGFGLLADIASRTTAHGGAQGEQRD